MSPRIKKVCQLFPNHVFLISQMARRNEDFLSLCEEYELAVDALQQLESRDNPIAGDLMRLAEYRALTEELKVDLLRQLQISAANTHS